MKVNRLTKKALKNTKNIWRPCTPDSMKAVKDKNKYINLITSTEARVFNKIDLSGFTNVNSLDEREQYIADELYKKDILEKVSKGEQIGYKTYKQKYKI